MPVIPSEAEESRPCARWRSLDFTRDDTLVLQAHLRDMTLKHDGNIDVATFKFCTPIQEGEFDQKLNLNQFSTRLLY